MQRVLLICGLLIGSTFLLPLRVESQPAVGATSQHENDSSSVEYPRNRAGIFIGVNRWAELANQMPAKTKVAHGIAASLSYGAVPAKIVAEYDGEHSATSIDDAQPTICVCHFNSLPGAPVLVKLHAKKGARELDGGRMTVYPIIGGAKAADANKSDLVATDVSQPEPQVWLVRPHAPLDPGEYALMLGTQNISIFSFTVEAIPAPATKP